MGAPLIFYVPIRSKTYQQQWNCLTCSKTYHTGNFSLTSSSYGAWDLPNVAVETISYRELTIHYTYYLRTYLWILTMGWMTSRNAMALLKTKCTNNFQICSVAECNIRYKMYTYEEFFNKKGASNIWNNWHFS